MATLKANGGVVRRWIHRRTAARLALCANGKMLINRGSGKWTHWKERELRGAAVRSGTDPEWLETETDRWVRGFSTK